MRASGKALRIFIPISLAVGSFLLLQRRYMQSITTDAAMQIDEQHSPERGRRQDLPKPTNKYDNVMNQREELVNQMCSKNIGVTTKTNPPKAYYLQRYDVYVCLVAKVASTFWSRTLYQLHHTDPVESPFDVGVQEAYNGLDGIRAANLPSNVTKGANTKLLFVREPYGRLFSAYIDKLLPPNPVYWKAWGQEAVMEFRHDHQQRQFVHGDDTTFSEFISFATRRGCKYDVHLTPVYKICKPCDMNFNTIGKMESFEQDAKYVISRLGIPEKQIGFDRMKKDKEDDALSDSTGGTFSPLWLRSTLRVISLEAVAQRVWRKLQIRGFISWRQKLRLSPSERKNLDMAGMVKLLKEAKAASTNRTELKIQKNQAFLESYSTLTPLQIQEIINVYEPDFKLFGYDTGLVEKLLQENPDLINTDSLDWSKDWDLSPILGS